MTKDRYTGLIAIILGAVIALGTLQIEESRIAGDIGPRIFPAFSAGLLIVCGACLLISGNKKEKSMFNRDSFKRLVAIFTVTLVYCIAMDLVGFFVPTAAVLFVLCTMFSDKEQTAWWKRLIFAVALTTAVYLLFHTALNMKLPTGRFF